MNILYCGDKNIEDGLIISILSLLKNVKEELNIYVLTANIKDKNINPVTDKTINYLRNYIQKINKKNSIKKIDITKYFLKELPVSNMDTRFTPCCMLRLFADQISELPSKILYLDNDVICRKDPMDFYNQNMSNYEISGVLDNYGKWFFKSKFFKLDYLNSGVLLMNLDNIRKNRVFENARKRCIEKNMFMPDQSAINKLAKNKLIVDRKYNEQKKLKNNTVFQHFTTTFIYFPYIHTRTIKPWNVDKLHNVLKIHEYDDILENYLKAKEDIYGK